MFLFPACKLLNSAHLYLYQSLHISTTSTQVKFTSIRVDTSICLMVAFIHCTALMARKIGPASVHIGFSMASSYSKYKLNLFRVSLRNENWEGGVLVSTLTTV